MKTRKTCLRLPSDGAEFEVRFKAVHGFVLNAANKTLTLEFNGKTIAAKLYYSFSDVPLTLLAAMNENAAGKLVVRPYRLELYVSDGGKYELCDEEWPCGAPLFAGEKFCANHAITVSEIKPENETVLPVMRSFTGSSSVRLPGVNIGDCIPFSSAQEPNVYHLFYLYDRHHHRSKWGLGAHQWAHISTRDIIHWDEHPMAIGITEPWEGSICTGSVIYSGDMYYAWYSVRMCDGTPARLMSALSVDGIHFIKNSGYFTLPPAYEKTSARDPKVFYFDGIYHMFVTTTRLSDGCGCLAHLVSAALDNWNRWEDMGTAYLSPDKSQPECPDWFEWNRCYYLVVGLHGVGHYLYSDKPFGPWISPENNIIPCGNVPKSALLGNRRIFMGFVGIDGYAGELRAAEAVQKPDGTLGFIVLNI